MNNLSMIHIQKKALEEAREAREQALEATRLKSNFLANMCKYCLASALGITSHPSKALLPAHELRTPFSGFYGMISLLSDTPLNPDQREFVYTAKESCEMLLQIIGRFISCCSCVMFQGLT